MLSFLLAVAAGQIVDCVLKCCYSLLDLMMCSHTLCCYALHNLSMVDASWDSRMSFESLAEGSVDSVAVAAEVLVSVVAVELNLVSYLG